MMENRPISELQNNFTEIEDLVHDGELICLTKDGFPSMVVMSVESYTKLLNETKDSAEKAKTGEKNSVLGNAHEEIFFRT